jgi:uncharacterized protein
MAILRKIKDKIKKAAQKKIKVPLRKKKEPKILKSASVETKNVILGAQETKVEQTKFSHPEGARARKPLPQELPWGYGQDKIVLLVRDTRWLHSYWELRQDTIDKFKNELGSEFYKSRRVIRVYDVSQINFNGRNAHRFFDVYVDEHANSWYIDTQGPGKSWCADYGLLLPDGRFIMIMRSNIVHTPMEGPSWITDEEWMVPEEMFARLYGMGFGLGRSSPVGKAWQERIKRELFSGVLASPGMASMASPVKKGQKARKFWLVVDCELIVYGATEPDADVSVQGKKINLRPDGTFTLRFALPDGKQVIPVKAISSDKIEERTITPTVTRETRQENKINE